MALPSPARSWLFAPGSDARKLGKAADGEADVVLVDLEDSVAPDRKAEARETVREFLDTRDDRRRLWVRINPIGSGLALGDLATVMPAGPGGIMLPKAEGRADVTTLHRWLEAFEAANGLEVGRTPVIALVTETPAAMFTAGEYVGDYPGSDRLAAMTWGAEDLSSALGAAAYRDKAGGLGPTYELARSLCLLGASSAGIAPIETMDPDFRDLESLERRARACWDAGFRGMLAIHPAQVPVINVAFTPSAAELDEARAIVAAFAEAPGAGTVGLEGRMLDRPHLDRATALLALAGE